MSRQPAIVLPAIVWLSGCFFPVARQGSEPAVVGQDIRLTILHTSDVHSRLMPYHFEPSYTDSDVLGLPVANPCPNYDVKPDWCDENDYIYGGIARIGAILDEERARASRVLHLDSGDSFQGALIFNEFDGEAEMRLMTEIGLDAAVVANHEFDKGAANLAKQYGAWGGFDLLAGNYDFEDSDLPWAPGLEDMVLPSRVYDLDGLRVGVIGLGNVSSLNSIYDESNSMGIKVTEPEEVLVREAGLLRSQGADIVVALSHMGLHEDIHHATTIPGIDIFIGGHHHIATRPPIVVTNEVTDRAIPVVHSGAFSKFVGRVDFVVRDGEILSFDHTLRPVANFKNEAGEYQLSRKPEVLDILEEYEEALASQYNTAQVIGYANETLRRYSITGGDSMLGNFTSEAMRFYPGVETEIALTNTLGIRADIPAGEITVDALFNSMPFDNTITTMFLSGREVQELLDYVSNRSTDRGCSSQAQVAGIEFTMVCNPDNPHAADIRINGIALDPDGTYELATNNYIAHGGSGFEVLERNTTQVDTGISIRDVVMSAFIQHHTLPQAEAGVCVEDGRIATRDES
jgi:5'-nucleotidase / UDP-sugar diphosphatase